MGGPKTAKNIGHHLCTFPNVTLFQVLTYSISELLLRMTCVTLVKAALARFLFAIHALMTIWRVVQQEGDDYWKLAVGILCLLGEGTLYTVQRSV